MLPIVAVELSNSTFPLATRSVMLTVPAEKLPDASRATKVLTVLRLVPSVARVISLALFVIAI